MVIAYTQRNPSEYGVEEGSRGVVRPTEESMARMLGVLRPHWGQVGGFWRQVLRLGI